MIQLAANLSMLFGEHEFMERFSAASNEGFRFVEYLFPYAFGAREIKKTLEENRLKQVLFNLPAGNWEEGDRGIAANPGRVDEFRKGVDAAIEYAGILEVDQVNCLAGIISPGHSTEEQWNVLVENLAFASEKLENEGVTLLVEAINTFDIPGFILNKTADVLKLLDDVGNQNLKYQYDMYHMQRMEGELLNIVNANLDKIGHIQIADNPGRNQPGTGEINYQVVFNKLEEMGYGGYVGLEYKPVPDTVSSLEWIEKFGIEL